MKFIKYTLDDSQVPDKRAVVLVEALAPSNGDRFVEHLRRAAKKLTAIGLGEATAVALYSNGTSIWECPGCSPFAMNEDGLIL